MADAIYNEYFVAAGLGASTDWVVTFPTKHYYYANGSSIRVTAGVYDREEGVTPIPPLCPPTCSDEPTWLNYEVNVVGLQDAAHFNAGDPSGVFSSKLNTLFLPPNGDDGSILLRFYPIDMQLGQVTGPLRLDMLDANGALVQIFGMPVTGFMAYNIINAHAQSGLLANYGGTFRHRSTMACAGAGCPQAITQAGP
jgi:hypothetical protein